MKSGCLGKILRGLGILLIILIVLIYIGLPFGVGFFATRPLDESVDLPPAGFEQVTLTTEDNVRIEAWYAAGENGAAIILVPGAGGNRDNMRKQALMLQKHGFGVLAIDLRGHGESGGNTNQFGWASTADIGAAVDFLTRQADVEAMGGLGSSLGGEVLLGAASAYPQLQAIVSDGASFRTLEEYTDLYYQRPIYRNFTSRILFFSVGLFSGDQPPLSIRNSISQSETTEFLLIAGGQEKLEVDYNRMFVDVADGRATLWVAEDVGHVGALGRYPEDYEQRIMAFFEANLGQRAEADAEN